LAVFAARSLVVRTVTESWMTHATLLAYTCRSGRPRGAHDLLIAATAVTHGRTVVSTDASGFADLPGLALRLST
jgi:tRNA(fMet)-specific endonuclease VapC